MRKIRTYHEVKGGVGAEVVEQVVGQLERLRERLSGVGAVVAIASGKGGVGKSAVTANLAAALAARGRRVGALDADLNGPSLARMLAVSGGRLGDHAHGVVPPAGAQGVRVMSMELLQEAENAPLRWIEPESGKFTWQSTIETGALREFLSDVAWGELDFLLVDVPPGTDKIGRLLELLPDLDLMLLVTTPSESARFVVSKSARLVREAGVETVALVANMTEHECEHCGHRSSLFGPDGVERLASETALPVWASVPFDPRLGASTDAGEPLVVKEPEAAASRAIIELAARVEAVAGQSATAIRPGGDTPAGSAP